jgi:nicotinate-nucleotide pyrophosphorylase (carboxylating)
VFTKKIDNLNIAQTVKLALKEDIGIGDITTQSLVPLHKKIKASIICRQDAVLCGLYVAKSVFLFLDNKARIQTEFADGLKVKRDTRIMTIEGRARAILTAERTALNLLSHLTGVATQTNKFVEKIKPYNVKIVDTRKTLPGLRMLEKYAVICGGGFNHRLGLWDMILIKDNHKKILGTVKEYASDKIGYLIRKARKINRNKLIEIEVENLQEVKAALEAKPDVIMLDNMRLADIRKAVRLRKARRPLLEVSGNVNLNKVKDIAQTGIDIISIGSLTHSVKAVDFHLEVNL